MSDSVGPCRRWFWEAETSLIYVSENELSNLKTLPETVNSVVRYCTETEICSAKYKVFCFVDGTYTYWKCLIEAGKSLISTQFRINANLKSPKIEYASMVLISLNK